MDTKKAIGICAPFFGSYPTVKEFHVTEDEQVFERAADAGNHARTFEKEVDQEVTTVRRSDWLAAEATGKAKPSKDANTPPAGGAGSGKGADGKPAGKQTNKPGAKGKEDKPATGEQSGDGNTDDNANGDNNGEGDNGAGDNTGTGEPGTGE